MFGIPNPQKLLQPWRNLQHFSEELYAMMRSRQPVTHEGPVTIRVKPNQTALKLTSSDGPDQPSPFAAVARPRQDTRQARQDATSGIDVGSSNRAPSRTNSATTAPQVAGPGLKLDQGQTSTITPADYRRSRSATPEPADFSKAFGVPTSKAVEPPSLPTADRERRPILDVQGAVDFGGPSPVRFERPPQVLNPATGNYDDLRNRVLDYPVDPYRVVFMGKVSSGTGNTYQVVLYPDGPDGDPGDTVTVKIQNIAADETLDPATWLVPVFRLSAGTADTYYAQPAVWSA